MNISILIVIVVISILYNKNGIASDIKEKYSNSKKYDHSFFEDSLITITSDYAIGNYPNDVLFIGTVNIKKDNSHLKANQVQFYQRYFKEITEPIRMIYASGNVSYEDDRILLKGLKGWINLNNKDINIWKGNYKILNYQFFGEADLIKQRNKNGYTILKNGSFTSCLPDSNAWSIIGSKIIYDRKEKIFKIWNARFRIGSIPIFYSPYLYFPIDNNQRSGFLIPGIKYNTSGYFEFYFPYYWHITPNIDVTITPNYIHKFRKIMLKNEICYLTRSTSGLMKLHYLPSYKHQYLKTINHHRWLLHWEHNKNIDQSWNFNINFTKISDLSFFKDFNIKLNYNVDDYLSQQFHFNYKKDNLAAKVSVKKFQAFDSKHIGSYSVKPYLDINWHKNKISPFLTHLYVQAVRFIKNNSDAPESIRLHFEPTINLKLKNIWTNLDTEVKLITTYYRQKNCDQYNTDNNTYLKSSVIRILPQFKLDSKSTFERNINYGKNCVQTFESQIQYLYIPYRNQRSIFNYDSSLLQLNFKNLFHDRIYSGLDRISGSNQIKTGITTRFFNNAFIESFNISLGQICYLTSYTITDSDIIWKRGNKIGPLFWIGDACWHINNHWLTRSDIQYDARLGRITNSTTSIEYRKTENYLVQLNYFHTSSKYIQSIFPKNDNKRIKNYLQNRDGISQIDIVTNLPIANRFLIVGSFCYKVNKNKIANQMMSLQYNSCCYTIKLSYERKLHNWNTTREQNKYENFIGFNIALCGLNSDSNLGTR